MTVHHLKTIPEYFQAVWDGTKTFEYRVNDRGFVVNDDLLLEEWSNQKANYTGRCIKANVTYKCPLEGHCIMSIKVEWKAESPATRDMKMGV